MHCYYHPRRPAVSQCQDCGKGLCRRCASRYQKPICPECNNQRRKKERKTYLMPLIVCAVLFMIVCTIGGGISESPLLIGYLCMSLYGGWGAVGLLFNHIFVMLDLRSIAVYILVRVILSVIVGVVATPFYLGYCIYRLIKLERK